MWSGRTQEQLERELRKTGVEIADDDDNKVFYLDIKRPQLRYGRIVVSRSAQNATVSAGAVLDGFRDKPITQPAGVSDEHSGPASLRSFGGAG